MFSEQVGPQGLGQFVLALLAHALAGRHPEVAGSAASCSFCRQEKQSTIDHLTLAGRSPTYAAARRIAALANPLSVVRSAAPR